MTKLAKLDRTRLLALPPLLVVAGLALTQLFVIGPDMREARHAVARTMEVRRLAASTRDELAAAESAQRGYLITGDDAYLQPYEVAVPLVPRTIAALQALVSREPDQAQRVLDLDGAITTKLNELAATLSAMRGPGGREAALAIVRTDVGLDSMSRIRALLHEIGEVSNARLDQDLRAVGRLQSLTTLAFLAAAAITILALAAGDYALSAAYRRLHRSEATMRLTLDSVREGVAAFDEAQRLETWNAGFGALFGLPPEALVAGESPERLAARGGSALRALLALGRAPLAAERPVIREYKDESGRLFELFRAAMPDGGFVATCMDMTERRRMEDIARQAQKLEALGGMTGGIAHDFNNLLTVILGNVEALSRDQFAEARARDKLSLVEMAARRGATLTAQLLAFARRQPLEPVLIDLSRRLGDVLALVRRAVGPAVTVESVVAAGLWSTQVDPTQFETGLLNLAINARDAMPEGGRLTIELANAFLDDRYAAQHGEVSPGQYVLVAVTDTGLGMDPPTMARALEPFFTTKGPGQGTGLGLSMVFGFVKQSGGHLKLYSEPGQGTTVKIYLPRALASAGSAGAPRSSGAPLHLDEGDEALEGRAILVVDDDESVLATVRSMLAALGYAVTAVAGPEAGLAALTEAAREGRRFDLLFTDIVMPGIDGRRLAAEAGTVMPGLPVLFTSGYTENAVVHNGRLDPGVQLLSKPFTSDQLAAKLRVVLAPAGVGAPP